MTPEAFVAKWENCPGHERANYGVFLSDLATMLGVPTPGPGGSRQLGDYQLDGPVPGGAEGGGTGFIDLYKRGAFILEAKQSKIPAHANLDMFDAPADAPSTPAGTRYDELMRRAFRQALRYARSLPEPPFPPFIIVCDVGRAFELYFDGAGNGRDYRFFPDRASYRVPLRALLDPAAQTLFRTLWTDARSLDPRLRTVAVTRSISRNLAEVSRHIEEEIGREAGRDAWTAHQRDLAVEESALFLMRMLFCMFAEDAGLLPPGRFTAFLAGCAPADGNDVNARVDTAKLNRGLVDLWENMGVHGRADRWSWAVEHAVRYFNGGLFDDTRTFPLARNDLGKLIDAGEADWRNVEPAIFGTLLEQALTPEQRSKLGAHYTPRPYVERVVEATILDVLRPEWEAVEAGLDGLTPADALAKLSAFHDRLACIRVLDPACGTGNFLYVAMEALLGLEARLIEVSQSLGGAFRSRVGPGQFHGLELNPRAAKIAELVLWIGWLRWAIANGDGIDGSIPEPILGQRANINFGRPGGYDAVLAQDEAGAPDMSNPRRPDWPEAEFIVGNPPFIGGKDLRRELGGDYAQALWRAAPQVPPSADFVMQWWDRAATILTAPGTRLRRFGFVTTNSITQEFSRRVIARHLSPSPLAGEGGTPMRSMGEGEGTPEAGAQDPAMAQQPPGLSLVMACPDHPWTKATKDAAAIRIAMTVAEAGASEGVLLEIEHEAGLATDTPELVFTRAQGRINPDLSVGSDLRTTKPLLANEGLASRGVALHGAGFIVSATEAQELGIATREGLDRHIRPYRHGRDLMQFSRGAMVIDLFGLDEREVRQRFPEVYQHLLTSVHAARTKIVEDAERAGKSTADARAYLKLWWLHGKPRSELRPALASLSRYIATVETSKHRIFQFLEAAILPDNKLIAVGSADASVLGVLSSRIHVQWAWRAGGWLGVGNDTVYVKSKVFDPFPFPDATPAQHDEIAALAEELDVTRKAALAETPRLTMTELYNLRERIAAGEVLAGPDATRATAARAWIVHRLHEQIDAAVARAYGWEPELAPAEIVARLVALNAARAAEEAAGQIRWLRPDYQIPRFAPVTGA